MMNTKTNTKWTVLGLALGLLLAALDQTIVATAMPTIVGEFGDFEKFIWVFSAYMIASVTAMPIFGKLSDMYGRKLFFLCGLILFMVGSALCGMSQNMLQLIIFRAIQGIGGGALLPITFTIIFDIFPPEKRAKTQGFFGAVFGISSVLGPIVGAFFTDYVHWRWIFYINLPLGIIAFFLLLLFYFESMEHKRQKIDWAGTVTLAATILSLMFALELGGKEYAWASAPIIGLFGAFVVLLILFLFIEKRAQEPIVPLQLFKNRVFTASMGICFFFGALMIGAASYIPLFIQGVFAGSATSAGSVLTPMMLSVVASSSFGGYFTTKTTYRNIMLCSVVMLLIAVGLLGTISIDTPRWLVTLYMIMMGLGIGASFPIISMSAQHQIPFHQRGSVNSMVTSFRTIGSAIGVTVLGTIQMSFLSSKFMQLLKDPTMVEQFKDPQVLLQPAVRQSIQPNILQQMIDALAESIAFLFQCSIIFVVLAIGFILLMGKTRMEIRTTAPEKGK